MNALTLLIRPDLGRKAYRLRCRFTANAFPDADLLAKAKFKAAEMFVRDMRKQGWDYLDKHGFKMSGPYFPMQIVNLPKRHMQAQWHTNSRDLLPQIQNGYRAQRPAQESYVRTLLTINDLADWDFELAGVFVHQTILVETADAHEEQKELRTR